MSIFYFIFFAIILNTAAQLLLKVGMTKIGSFTCSFNNLMPIFWQVCLSPAILFGLSCYVFSVLVWLVVLSRADVSLAYPLTSLGYITTAVAAYYLFHEPLSATRLAGIVVIIVGVYLIARS